MFLTLRDMLHHAEIINLNSLFDGWTKDVKTLLSLQTFSKDTSCLSIPGDDLALRMRDLKYICLVNKLTMEKSREVFPPVVSGSADKLKTEELAENSCRSFLSRLRELMDRRNTNERQQEEDENPPWLPPERDDNRNAEAIWPPFNAPHYGGAKDEVKPTVILVIVDCAGMYVRSLKKWLQGIPLCTRSEVMDTQLNKLMKNPELDGPAVLLCPETIERIYGGIVRRCPPALKLVFEELVSNPHLMFLKFTLLHELGHHIFPVSRISPSLILSEALADWFTYWLIPPADRIFLHEQAQELPMDYQTYEGLLPLLFPKEAGGVLAAALDMYVPTNLATWLERRAFRGDFGHLPHLEEESLIDEIDLACEFLLNVPPFIPPHLVPVHKKAGYHQIPIHPSWGSTCEVLSAALNRLGTRPAVGNFMNVSLNHMRPMQKYVQRQWLEKMWALPRPATR